MPLKNKELTKPNICRVRHILPGGQEQMAEWQSAGFAFAAQSGAEFSASFCVLSKLQMAIDLPFMAGREQ
jgi:hypothetical protein